MAAVQGGRLLDYALHRPAAPDWVGAVLRGRVTARAPALAGAFVALGEAGDGFLPDSAGGKSVGEGVIVAVRVVRAAQGGKGPRLARAEWPPLAPGAPGLLAPGPDALQRLAALHAEAAIVVDDTAVLAGHPELRPRLTLRRRAFDDALEGQVAALGEVRCVLPGGGAMTIEPTAALVAIDLDLGRRSGERGDRGAVHGAANAGFVAELARAIRVRNLGGPIVVDFAGMPPRRRAALGPALMGALAGDPAGPRFLGFSGLGLAEILRPRVHPPLHEWLGTPHAAALAALRAVARENAADPSRAPVLAAAPDVAAALGWDAAARADLLRRSGRGLVVRTDDCLPSGAWRLGPLDATGAIA